MTTTAIAAPCPATPYPATLRLFVAGRWVEAGDRATEPVLNPATGEVLGHLPHATAADLDGALDGAERAFGPWRRTTAFDRAWLIGRAAATMRERRDDLARLITLEQGKPLAESRNEVSNAADLFDWFAEEGRRAYGRVIPPRQPGHRMLVLQEPVGPVAAFAAWNVPAQTMARKVGAALAAGCPVILKPSEETPATPLAIAAILEEAGLPPGVLSVVFGVPDTISRHLLASPVIRKLTFTGSTVVGRHLARLAADGLKRATLELGGHAPVLVFDDVDVAAVAQAAAAAKYRNAGQVCISPTRFYVQEAVHDRFVDAFAAAAAALRQGDGLDPATQVGPCANIRRVEAMERFVEDGRRRGGQVVAGGTRGGGNAGFFFAPTLVTGLPDDALAFTSEPFGPLAVTRPFATIEQGVALANRLPYGLASYVFSRDAARITAASDGIEAGMVAVNNWVVSTPETPFGGWKESGYGSEGGIEGLQAFLSTKFVHQA